MDLRGFVYGCMALLLNCFYQIKSVVTNINFYPDHNWFISCAFLPDESFSIGYPDKICL